MKQIKIDNIRIGDILAQPVIKQDGIILLSEGITLTSEYIHKIKNAGIKTVYIYDSLFKLKNKKTGYSNDIREENISLISTIYNKVVNFDSIEIDEITPIIDNVLTVIRNGEGIPSGLIETIRLKDDVTYIHSLNTCFLSVLLGEYMHFTDEALLMLGTGALLHDLGKVNIDEKILKKADKLTSEEFDIMKKHTIYGYNILNKIHGIHREATLISLNHHEKYDGSGYPRGLKGGEIDYFSQIVSVCDVYDALLSTRSYKQAFKPNECFEFILSKTGIYFNLEIVKAFRNCILLYPNGVGIKLSDGRLGFVVKQNNGFPDRPIINVVTNQKGDFVSPEELNLMTNLNIVISDIISK